MSAYKVIKTECKSKDSLRAALQAIGVPFEEAETENGLTLVDWHGQKRPEKGTFVIRRRNITAMSNDLGFTKLETGGYGVIISDYDEATAGDRLFKNVLNSYAEIEVTRLARAKGLTVERITAPGGAIRLRLHGRA
jgi:Protein of unknown function (DUF1257)